MAIEPFDPMPPEQPRYVIGMHVERGGDRLAVERVVKPVADIRTHSLPHRLACISRPGLGIGELCMRDPHQAAHERGSNLEIAPTAANRPERMNQIQAFRDDRLRGVKPQLRLSRRSRIAMLCEEPDVIALE